MYLHLLAHAIIYKLLIISFYAQKPLKTRSPVSWSPERPTISVGQLQYFIQVVVIIQTHVVAILIGHLKMNSESVKEAVLSCDTRVLSESRLSQMEAFAPDKREVISVHHNVYIELLLQLKIIRKEIK